MEESDKLDKIISILLVIKAWIIFFGITIIIGVLSYLFLTYISVKEIEQINQDNNWQERINQ